MFLHQNHPMMAREGRQASHVTKDPAPTPAEEEDEALAGRASSLDSTGLHPPFLPSELPVCHFAGRFQPVERPVGWGILVAWNCHFSRRSVTFS